MSSTVGADPADQLLDVPVYAAALETLARRGPSGPAGGPRAAAGLRPPGRGDDRPHGGAVRRGLGPLRVAGRGRRPRRHDGPPRRHVGGAGPPRRAGHGAVRAPRDPRPDAGGPRPAPVRRRGAARLPRRPRALGPGLLRARRRLRPGQPAHHRASATATGSSSTAARSGRAGPRYATWCLVLARTGTSEERHRGLTAFIVDLRVARRRGVAHRAGERHRRAGRGGVRRRARPRRPHRRRARRRVGGGHAHPEPRAGHVRLVPPLLPLPAAPRRPPRTTPAATTGTSATPCSTWPRSPPPATPAWWPTPPARRSARRPPTPSSCSARPSRRCRTAPSPPTPTWPSGCRPRRSRSRRQEYLFSRIVTVYGGSQQMQLDTIAKQILRLP